MLLLVALAVGGLIPIQTAANSRLRMSVGNKPVMPALISFSSALFFAVVATTVLRGNPMPQFSADVPWWGWLGGVMGVCFVLGNILLFPRLGALETVVLPILGQVVMGLLVDRFGLLGAPAMPVSWMRVLGAAVVFAGIVVVLRSGRRPVLEGDAEGLELAIFRVLGVLVGVCTAIQTSVNGYMGGIAGSSMHAGEINLAVGAVLLLVAALATSPRQLTRRPEPGPWWMWLGGMLGAFFVFGGAALSPILGTGTTVIAALVGNIICGQVLESLGVGTGGRRSVPTPYRLTGLAIVLAGVVMVRML